MADWIEKFNNFASQKWEMTKLNESEEKKFKDWFQNTKLFNSIKEDVALENNMPITAIDNKRIMEMLLSSKDYDYKAAWKAGVEEVISPYDNKPHWPSGKDGKMFKSPKHPTTWKEFFMNQYKTDPDSIGLTNFESAVEWSKNRPRPDPRAKKRPLMVDR